MQDVKAEQHAEQLAWLLESWSSMELRVTRTATDFSREYLGAYNRPPDFDQIRQHYIETATGKRYLDEIYLKPETREYHSRQTYYFDGRRGADVTASSEDPKQQNQVVLHRHFAREGPEPITQRPIPLFYYWIDLEPLHEAISRARYLGQEEVLGRTCDRFLFQGVGISGNAEKIYSLDAETSVPLEFELYSTKEDRLAERPLSVWTAEELGEVEGYPVVLKSVKQSFSSETGNPTVTREYQVESIAYNKDYPASQFWPELDPGALVADNVKGTLERIPGGEELRQADLDAADAAFEAQTDAQATTLDPAIRADPPKSWSFYATSATLGLGCAAILVSLWLWWRRG